MILKLVSPSQEVIDNVNEEFIDGFDKIDKEEMSVGSANKDKHWTGILVHCYYDEKASEEPVVFSVIRLKLMKEDMIIRILYLDNRYSIYLLNNEGKTIERLH